MTIGHDATIFRGTTSTGARCRIVAGAAQPAVPTATEATDSGKAACESPSDPDQPLVVDMPPEDRADLEIAMRGKVAVVAYDCKSLKVLRDCRVEGEYAFFGTTVQEKTVRLTTNDEISVVCEPPGDHLVANGVDVEILRASSEAPGDSLTLTTSADVPLGRLGSVTIRREMRASRALGSRRSEPGSTKERPD